MLSCICTLRICQLAACQKTQGSTWQEKVYLIAGKSPSQMEMMKVQIFQGTARWVHLGNATSELYAVTRLTAHSQELTLCVVWCLIRWSASLEEKKLVIHDAKCSYWDQMSLCNPPVTPLSRNPIHWHIHTYLTPCLYQKKNIVYKQQ